ncbi:MAG: coproporphyrinogen dehydrogenase HemZ [Eubacteriaceae bacterium]|nr:coproporphyrinogen dehydrogenase HemZ [Eubacteriaceae bacterium]
MNIFLQLSKTDYERQIKNIIYAFFLPAEFVACRTQEIDLALFVEILQDKISIRLENAKEELIKEKSFSCKEEQRSIEIEQAVYEVISEAYGYILPWGILTGVRPVKIASRLLKSGVADEQIIAEYTERRFVNAEKAKLCLSLAKKENNCLQNMPKNAVALYVHIPICPHRCKYCSFISKQSTDQYYIAQYLNALLQEIRAIGAYFSNKNILVDSLYIGGGTPALLDADMIEKLLFELVQYFDTGKMREATFEAGRADCITVEKLEAMKEGGMSRICINAQSMHNETLQSIGRGLTKEEFLHAYALARKYSFAMNVDLIYGLEGENESMFYDSLEQVISLQPENITLHTLAYKKKAKDFENKMRREREHLTGFDSAYGLLKTKGYVPYYLYRQKHAVSGGENTGFCKEGTEGIYNISVLSDRVDIIALGAGAVGKICEKNTHRIRRVDGCQEIDFYIQHIHEVIHKKRRIYEASNKVF